MWKKILIVLIVILSFLFASIYIFRANIKRYAIQTILKSFPLPNVALANVRFDETTGRLNLEDIKVKNPKGFSNKYIMEADSINMDINFTAKPQLQLNINKIGVTNPVFYVERSSADKWNFLEYPKKNLSPLAESPEGRGTAVDAAFINKYFAPLSAEGEGVGMAVSLKKDNGFDFIKNAFAAEGEKRSEILLPRTINITNGAVHILDNFVAVGKTHKIDLSPVTGDVSLHYSSEKHNYEKIIFNGSCNIDGSPGRMIKGNFQIYPMEKIPSYMWEFNASNVPLSTIKPYLDRYTPFIVAQGSFNMASTAKSADGAIGGDYTMEFMDLVFALNPEKSNIPFLETSVKKLTLYLTNQKGNVVIDFKQRGEVGGKTRWELGPIAKRAIGLMAIDTVMEVIDAIEKTRKGGAAQEMLPKDIPPEVIDIFRGIFK